MEDAVHAGSIKLWFIKRNSHARHCVSIIEHIFHSGFMGEEKDFDGDFELIKDKDFEADCIHLKSRKKGLAAEKRRRSCKIS